MSDMAHDIPFPKQTEETLRERKERFRLVPGNAPVTAAVQDRDPRFLYAFNQRHTACGNHRQNRLGFVSSGNGKGATLRFLYCFLIRAWGRSVEAKQLLMKRGDFVPWR